MSINVVCRPRFFPFIVQPSGLLLHTVILSLHRRPLGFLCSPATHAVSPISRRRLLPLFLLCSSLFVGIFLAPDCLLASSPAPLLTRRPPIRSCTRWRPVPTTQILMSLFSNVQEWRILRNDDRRCCNLREDKCWRHFLKDVRKPNGIVEVEVDGMESRTDMILKCSQMNLENLKILNFKQIGFWVNPKILSIKLIQIAINKYHISSKKNTFNWKVFYKKGNNEILSNLPSRNSYVYQAVFL